MYQISGVPHGDHEQNENICGQYGVTPFGKKLQISDYIIILSALIATRWFEFAKNIIDFKGTKVCGSGNSQRLLPKQKKMVTTNTKN